MAEAHFAQRHERVLLETTESELMRTMFPHPTLSETMHEAVLDAYGRAIHF